MKTASLCNEKQKKEDILKNITFDLSCNYYDIISNVLTTEMNMVSYGINLKKYFIKHLKI